MTTQPVLSRRFSQECLEFALPNPEETEFGVWGGTTPGQRRKIQQERKRERRFRRVANVMLFKLLLAIFLPPLVILGMVVAVS